MYSNIFENASLISVLENRLEIFKFHKSFVKTTNKNIKGNTMY
jgi:hypothetical protein